MKDKYYTQKSGANARGIEWHFTYETWLEWWGDDIHNRGNKSGQLVMARKGDTGPYHPDNVIKITANENHSQAHKHGLGWGNGSKHSIETREKIKEKLEGRVMTEEHRAKLAEKNKSRAGIPRSPEVREKIRATLLARKQQAYDPST